MPVISGGVVGQPGKVLFQEITLSEVGAAGVYTGTATVPENSWLLDIKIYNLTYWGAGTSASLIVGDGVDPDGWFTAVDLKATDIVDFTTDTNAEVIDFDNPGGTEGAYLVSATGERQLMYSTLERVITAEVTTVGTTSAVGRTRIVVLYTDPTTPTAASYVAS